MESSHNFYMRHERAYLIFVLDHTSVYSTENKKEKEVIRVMNFLSRGLSQIYFMNTIWNIMFLTYNYRYIQRSRAS